MPVKRMRAPSPVHQVFQHGPFAGRQFDGLAIYGRAARERIQLQAAQPQLCRTRIAATDQCLEARDQLRRGKWLDQIIIGTGLQPAHTVLHIITRGQEQHRQAAAACSQPAYDLEPVDARQPNVQYRDRHLPGLQCAVRIITVVDDIHHHAMPTQDTRDAIGQHRIDPAKLKLELTESVSLDDIDHAIGKIELLQKFLGLSVSLDDFGTGYSSLSYLNRLPFDQIKIDQSFVRNFTDSASSAVMIKTIINLAHNYGCSVIAEGVETMDQFRFLRDHGCLSYQGYLFGKPMPVEEFERLILGPEDPTVEWQASSAAAGSGA